MGDEFSDQLKSILLFFCDLLQQPCSTSTSMYFTFLTSWLT